MLRKYVNNFKKALNTSINNLDTTVTVVQGSTPAIPAISPPEYVMLTLTDTVSNASEIVKAVALNITGGGVSQFTVSRGQEGTTAQAFSASTCMVSVCATAQAFSDNQYFENLSLWQPQPWGSALGYSIGDIVLSSTADKIAYALVEGGLSGGTEPTWGHTPGSAIVTDNLQQWLVTDYSGTGLAGDTWRDNGLGVLGYPRNSQAIAIGSVASAFGRGPCIAIGDSNVNIIDKSHSILGLPVMHAGAWVSKFSSVPGYQAAYGSSSEAVFGSQLLDFKSTGTAIVSVAMPAKTVFFVDEICAVVSTTSDTISAAPFLSFGIVGSNAALLAATQMTTTAANGRNRYTTLLTANGQTSLTASITTAATGTGTLKGRVYFKGVFVETDL
jgi:hypothetical protein